MPEVLELITVAPGDFRTGPMPRHEVPAELWEQAAGDAARGMLTLLSLWAEGARVHMALRNVETGHIGILSYHAKDGHFPSVGRIHAPAQRLERTIRDLHGLVPDDAIDARPWLDHGRWQEPTPLGKGDSAATGPYEFLPVEGDSLHQVPVGPVHAGVIEPGHFRFTAQGETVVRLEERLGYVHKGIDAAMQGASIDRGADLAARTSGDSTVAYGWAYAQAVEAALGVEVPSRAAHLRAVMAEMERLANHLGDIGAICNDAAFAMMLAQCGVLREQVLRAADSVFGHRLMRDVIRPGGVTRDIDAAGIATIRALLATIRDRFPGLVRFYDRSASLLDRTVSTGIVSPDLTARFGAGGYVGRASGRDFDTRRDLAYAPYDRLSFEVAGRTEGDVNARIWVRIDEVTQALALIEQALARLPEGPLSVDLPTPRARREGLGKVEGFRGDILIWLALDGRGRIARCHMRDPSWFQWPLLEAAIEGNIIADFPLCNKSFNCSYSGHDL